MTTETFLANYTGNQTLFPTINKDRILVGFLTFVTTVLTTTRVVMFYFFVTMRTYTG